MFLFCFAISVFPMECPTLRFLLALAVVGFCIQCQTRCTLGVECLHSHFGFMPFKTICKLYSDCIMLIGAHHDGIVFPTNFPVIRHRQSGGQHCTLLFPDQESCNVTDIDYFMVVVKTFRLANPFCRGS